MSKFHPFSKVRAAVGIFLSKIETSPNCFKFHIHVPRGDSNKFCKFHEFRRTLRKCQNFILFLRSGAVGIFLSKIETSPNCFKFHMHFPGSDSNKFCKFHEFWRTLRKCQNFILFLRSGSVGIFLSKIETSPNCFKLHMHVTWGDSNKFCKFHEFWRTLRNVKISIFSKVRRCRHFSVKNWNFSKLFQISYAFLEVIPINSVSFVNFGELWENVKILFFF